MSNREKVNANIPTAAFRLWQRNTRKPTKIRLTPHAAMLAALEAEWPIRGMPHAGLIPTGADEVGIESPVSVSGEARSSYNEWLVRFPLEPNYAIDGLHIPDDKKDCTKDN